MKKIVIILSLIMTSMAQAQQSTDFKNLQDAAVAKFLKLANNTSSALGKSLAQINKDTEDGRNANGTIALPVKKSDLQVTVLEAEELYAAWHFSSKSNGYCVASGDSATILISLSQHTGAHSANEFNTVKFLISAQEHMSAKILKDSDDLYCEDMISEEADKLFGPTKTTISVSEPKSIEIK